MTGIASAVTFRAKGRWSSDIRASLLQEFQHALGRSGDDRPVAVDDDRALHQLGVLEQ